MRDLFFCFVLFLFVASTLIGQDATGTYHVWEVVEIELAAAKDYANPYAEVTCWAELEGPDFSKRVYGFWDGDSTFRIRLTAPAPGEWTYTTASNQPDDAGLNGHSGTFLAEPWTAGELAENPVRRGYLRPDATGHALQFADGTPFFMLGDTWLAGSTWRLPFRGAVTDSSYQPGPGIGFEDAVLYRKRQGFNSVSMIAAFPNWDSDVHPSTYADANGVYLRNAWEKFGYTVSDSLGRDASGDMSYWGSFTAKNMRDEWGNLPFEPSAERKELSDFDRINPAYFQSLDQKMAFLSEHGFTSLLETVRRDAGPSWAAYFDFNESFARYFQYLVARYGAYNVVFSGIHLDWIPEDFSLTADQFNEALTYHHETYGPPPFGQPVTALINNSTLEQFGSGDTAPWLTIQSVGNKPRDHRVSDSLESIFALEPPYPAINFEPYYTGWDHEINKPGGERPPADSERDNYFARAQMYGSVLSGGLAGHVHGTAAYDITTTGEPAGARPHFWEALRYASGNYMAGLGEFMLSEGDAYAELRPVREDLHPHKASDAPYDGLDGWAYMLRDSAASLALLYFEHGAEVPEVHGLQANATYRLEWYNPVEGSWQSPVTVRTDGAGVMKLSEFPEDASRSYGDWAAKLRIAD
ncbi:DUF5060 domain-containing protein [Lewinella sp. IMCC34191]|uniref:DUF5060 domain-containing protein n=1 Tax=Lewinella sp. IMCC34191 TaxID=2259172 RepID=UPI000E266778|nr:DUF5060 domain-containing protein [Lewinella sp. IMCC34191]